MELENTFDPNGIGAKGTLFGLPYSVEDSDIVLIPVPWEVTVSYRGGTSDGPQAILEASSQVDLMLHGLREAWSLKQSMLPIPDSLKMENDKFRDLARQYIQWLEEQEEELPDSQLKIIPQTINEICEKLNIFITSQCDDLLNKGKIVGLVGGDHSTPIGLLRSLNKKFKSFGILQVDAHADLRVNYEDFVYSHASIMHNALKLPHITKLVQVGIRDYCEEELQYIERFPERISTFFQQKLKEEQFNGTLWADQCKRIINNLPNYVYISLDIDGLDPSLCPNTGTPVPGGLSFDEVTYLIRAVVRAGKKIIGFDINEVSPGEDEWDANVGARLLYNLSCWTGASNGLLLASIE